MVTDLGEQPTPEIEPAEPPPGGVDAVEEDRCTTPEPVVPDLASTLNPRRGRCPSAVTEGEDTDEGATTDGASEPEKEAQHDEQDRRGHRQRAGHRARTPTPTPAVRSARPAGWGSAASGSGRPEAAQESTDGERDTSAPDHRDDADDVIGSDAEIEPGCRRRRTNGISPKAGYPSKDPRSADSPYKDA